MSNGGVGTLPAPILKPTRGNQRHVTREKLGTLAFEHKGKYDQLIAEIARPERARPMEDVSEGPEKCPEQVTNKGQKMPQIGRHLPSGQCNHTAESEGRVPGDAQKTYPGSARAARESARAALRAVFLVREGYFGNKFIKFIGSLSRFAW